MPYKRLLALLLMVGLYTSPGRADPIVAYPLSYLPSTNVSVTTISSTLAAAGVYTRVLNVCTLPNSTVNIWLDPSGGTAVSGSGLPVYAGGKCVNFGGIGLPIPTAAITAVTDNGAAPQTVALAGG